MGSEEASLGLTFIRATVANPANPKRSAKLRFLVDSGALYSVVPAGTLLRLGIKPHSTRTFTLADGTEIERKMGDASFAFDGVRGASPVIFGEKGDSTLLGTVSLESLGLSLDPIRRVLRPLPMVLG
jgi:clan AA aspartic protease